MLGEEMISDWLISAKNVFIDELFQSNERFFQIVPSVGKTGLVFGLATMFVALLIDSYASYVLSRIKKSEVSLLIVEFLAILMTVIAFFLPGAPLRFFYGLVFFSSGMSIHSRVCSHFLDMRSKPSKVFNSSLDTKSETVPPFRERFFHELANTFYFNIFHRINEASISRLPSVIHVIRIIIVAVLADSCTFLIREWLPTDGNISDDNRIVAIAMVGGVWTLCAMDFTYRLACIQLDYFGTALPLELEHKHPLLSESLTEFWGIRWNPIVGKLLQDSFYKPLRRIGMSRAICVVACFTGSAVLHAVPQYLATGSLLDTSMMFGFFFLQGVCLVLELVVQRLFGCTSPRTPAVTPLATPKRDVNGETSTPHSPNDELIKKNKVRSKHEEAIQHSITCKSAPCQFIAELLVVVCILSTAYYALELVPFASRYSDTVRSLCVSVAATSGVGAVTAYYFMRRSMHQAIVISHVERNASNHSAQKEYQLDQFLLSLCGWVWVVVSIMILLPLFSLPVLHALESLYSQSFVVGALVRSAQRLNWSLFSL